MKRLVLIVILGLLAGMAQATFEIQDPAAQIMEEQKERGYAESEVPPEEVTVCVIDMDSNECFCIHKETRHGVEIAEEDCKARAASGGRTTATN